MTDRQIQITERENNHFHNSTSSMCTWSALLILKWSPSFFNTITNILGCPLLTNKIEMIKLFGVLGGRKDGFKLVRLRRLVAKWTLFSSVSDPDPDPLKETLIWIRVPKKIVITSHTIEIDEIEDFLQLFLVLKA